MSEKVVVAEQRKKSAVSRVTEKLGQVSLVTSVAVLTSPAFAALDVSSLETEITGNGTSIQTVMLWVLGLVALFVGYRFIKKALA